MTGGRARCAGPAHFYVANALLPLGRLRSVRSRPAASCSGEATPLAGNHAGQPLPQANPLPHGRPSAARLPHRKAARQQAVFAP